MAEVGAGWAVAVVGAGPAGCATAIALARRGVERVCLLDGGTGDRPVVGETVPPDTRVLLQRLGVWAEFAAAGHLPCPGSRSAWGDHALGYNDFLLSPYGPGWHLDRAGFDRMLRRAAAAAGVTVQAGARLDGVTGLPGGGWHLGPAIGPVRFLVDATGSASALGRRLGAQQRDADRLVAVYAFLDARRVDRPDRSTLLEAVEDGWWYSAALPGGRLAAAFTGDPDTIREGRLSHPANWLAAAHRTEYLRTAIEGCPAPDRLLVRSAPSFRLDPPAGPGWLAVGDAAASFDPLAAQGIHKALGDGLRAAEVITATPAPPAPSEPSPLVAHAESMVAGFTGYRDQRAWLYRLEQRWPDAPFWQRRQRPVSPNVPLATR